MTKGGLVEIRSNRSPATGSKNEPSRTSTSAPSSSALRRVIQSAREFTSVATTCVGVARQVERLHAAPGAEVERAADRLPHGQLREAGRRARDAEHVVGADPLGRTVEAGRQVRDDPEVAVLGGVGAAVHPRRDLADALLEQAGVAQPVDQSGQGPVRLVPGHRGLQQEEPDQCVERPARRRTTQRGEGLVASERAMRVLADRLGDPVVGEVRRRAVRRAGGR